MKTFWMIALALVLVGGMSVTVVAEEAVVEEGQPEESGAAEEPVNAGAGGDVDLPEDGTCPQNFGETCQVDEEDLPEVELPENAKKRAHEAIQNALQTALQDANQGDETENQNRVENQVGLPELPEDASEDARQRLREQLQEREHGAEDEAAQDVVDEEAAE